MFVTSAIVVFYRGGWQWLMVISPVSSLDVVLLVLGLFRQARGSSWHDKDRVNTNNTYLASGNQSHQHHLPGGELILHLNPVSFCHTKQGTEKIMNICKIFWQWGCQGGLCWLSVWRVTLVCDGRDRGRHVLPWSTAPATWTGDDNNITFHWESC